LAFADFSAIGIRCQAITGKVSIKDCARIKDAAESFVNGFVEEKQSART
jgi:hypothetical protein